MNESATRAMNALREQKIIMDRLLNTIKNSGKGIVEIISNETYLDEIAKECSHWSKDTILRKLEKKRKKYEKLLYGKTK